MIRTLLEWIASKLPAPRIIFDRAGRSKYLSRWYLFAGPTMPDGSHPFTEDGSPKVGIQDPDRTFAVFLHKFHRGDDDAELHDHPWTWAFALILSGGYIEERRRGAMEGGGPVFIREVRPFSLNLIHFDTFHRVELLEKDAWSLFVAGPREGGWSFWNRATGKLTPWREFIDRKRDPGAFAQAEPQCPACKGSGRGALAHCLECAGSGRRPPYVVGGFIDAERRWARAFGARISTQTSTFDAKSTERPEWFRSLPRLEQQRVLVRAKLDRAKQARLKPAVDLTDNELLIARSRILIERTIAEKREHFIGEEPLVEVEVFVERPSLGHADDCAGCDRYRRDAENGSASAHEAITS